MISVFFQLLLSLYSFNDTVPDFTKEFHQVSTRQMESAYIEKYYNSTNVSVQGYVISLKMKQSKYSFLPWVKLKNFKKEKDSLELLISNNPNNINLIYVRLVIQERLPKILNYYSDINKDKKFLKMILEKKDSTDYLDYYIEKNTSL